MDRRKLIKTAAASTVLAGAGATAAMSAADQPTRVAFLLSEGATVIDFAGPWEVFEDVMVGDRMPYETYTVAATHDPITATGGMRILPNYSFADAPDPAIVVIPAQKGGPEVVEWLRHIQPRTELVMSVCTGAFVLARTGLLDGLPATTHHDYFDAFVEKFPKVDLHRTDRFVDNGRLASAGGLTSGIDLALHVVDKRQGRDIALQTARYMEYGGERWRI
jgi:transcriptional regulator GlxA family with amidase domain